MTDFANQNISEFMGLLSGADPAPGGGGAAALGAALGVGLANMVASLTKGKEKYAAHEEEIIALLEAGLTLQEQLLSLIKADAQAFLPLAEAYRLPSATDAEKAAKKRALAGASRQAAFVPLEIAEKTIKAMKITRRMGEIGSILAVSDIGCGIVFLEAALKAARYNVLINLSSLNDPKLEQQIRNHLQALLTEGINITAETVALVDGKL